MSSKEIMEAALRLSEEDRVTMVERLLETLPDDVAGPIDEMWAAELERRLEDYKQHPETGVRWEELREME